MQNNSNSKNIIQLIFYNLNNNNNKVFRKIPNLTYYKKIWCAHKEHLEFLLLFAAAAVILVNMSNSHTRSSSSVNDMNLWCVQSLNENKWYIFYDCCPIFISVVFDGISFQRRCWFIDIRVASNRRWASKLVWSKCTFILSIPLDCRRKMWGKVIIWTFKRLMSYWKLQHLTSLALFVLSMSHSPPSLSRSFPLFSDLSPTPRKDR